LTTYLTGTKLITMTEDGKIKPKGVSISLTALADDDGEGVRYHVKELPAIIGRSDKCEVVIDGVGVAENHAQLTWSDNSLFLEDMGTGGVTMVNTSMVKNAKLRNGDLLEVGDGKLLVQIGTAEEEEEEPETSTETSAKKNGRVWVAGFGSELRDWFNSEIKKEYTGSHAYRTGEDILVDMSKSISKGRQPSAIVLDLRIPIINGINVAISLRAYEQGYKVEERIPIVFLFDPPSKSSFEKVMKFCSPVKILSPGKSIEETKATMKEYIESIAD